MKIVLEPIDHDDMAALTIDQDVFAIGRREEPFSLQTDAKSARLSRRHARIFIQDNRAYVADLGSLNGTYLNHELLNNDAAELHDGDELNFGGEFRFLVKLDAFSEDDRTMVAPPPPITVTLVPQQPESPLDTLVIRSFPFLFSRNSQVLKALKETHEADVNKISRRHAVLMLKHGNASLEDLGSANGTFVNGSKLDELGCELNHGDTIRFGDGIFEYKVALERTDEGRTLVAPSIAPAVPPAIKPTDAQETPQPSPPVSEPSPQEEAPEQPPLRELESAAHGSSDSAEPVPAERSAEVVEQDVAAANTLNESVVNAGAPQPSLDNGRTQFVDSATSFLDVFLEAESAAEASADSAGDSSQGRAANKGKGGRKAAHASALGDALGGRKAISSKVVMFGLAAVLLVAGAWTFTYYRDADQRSVKALLDEGSYAQAAAQAEQLLSSGPRSEAIARLGEEALIKSIVPALNNRLEAGEYERAWKLIEDESGAHPSIPRAANMMRLLSWMVDVSAHVAERPKRDAPLELFRHEEVIASIVTSWDKNADEFQRLASQIAQYDDTFEPLRTKTMSSLRDLREVHSIYSKAIEEFKQELRRHLLATDVVSAQASVRRLKDDFPLVVGDSRLLAEIDLFAEIVEAFEASELASLQAAYKASQEKMQVPLMRDVTQNWFDATAPAEEVFEAYENARAAWQSGDIESAVQGLEQISDPDWREFASAKAAQLLRVRAAFSELEGQRGQPDYRESLIEFWKLLQPEDTYFLNAIESEFAAYKEELAGEIGENFTQAQIAWDAFSAAGGIPGLMRVEDKISDEFKQQASNLARAHEAASQGFSLAELLQIELSPTQQSLHEQVESEVSRQRRWLQDLRIVLEAELLDNKLALLPKLKEKQI